MLSMGKLHLSDVPGEDVDVLASKLRALCKEVIQVGPPPLDLALVCARQFLSGQVTVFTNTMMVMVKELEEDASVHTWEEVLNQAGQEYDTLHNYWTPAGAQRSDSSTVSKREFANFVNTCTQQINNLKIKASNTSGGSGNSGSGSSLKTTKLCHDCGELGVVKGHPGCENTGENHFFLTI